MKLMSYTKDVGSTWEGEYDAPDHLWREVNEAGGEVSDAAGNPLDFSKGRYLDLETGIIVTNKKLMPSLLKAVRECLDEKPSSL
ncbi:SAL1 phosphatase [Vitis vinifera]|uniref:SAL1 phosphatase n=1 Tax=Vitis vinifera TaxID=29760 RepID=A0A438BTW7_VITVI|nr:SAL1 phosphatase [Vitis vinifera]